MKRARKKASKRWYSNPPSACLSLIPIDASETRAKERALYASCLKDLARQNRRAKTFLEKDTPMFQSWMEREFAKELKNSFTKIAALRELREVIEDVEEYAAFKEISERDAYRLLEAAKEEGREEALWQEIERQQARQEARQRREEAQEDISMEDPLDADRIRGAFGHSKSSERYLKSIYRQLVRKLHPDMTGTDSEANRLLWEEVQDAYKLGDLHALERLLKGLNEKGPDFDLGEIPIGDIVELRRDAESRLFLLKLEMSDYKTSPAWNFPATLENGRRLAQFKLQLAEQMELEMAAIEQATLECETRIGTWQQNPRPMKKKRSRRSRRN